MMVDYAANVPDSAYFFVIGITLTFLYARLR